MWPWKLHRNINSSILRVQVQTPIQASWLQKRCFRWFILPDVFHNHLIYSFYRFFGTASPCRPDPCQNGGTCMRGRKHSSFQCSCPGGYTGSFCEVGKTFTSPSLRLPLRTHTPHWWNSLIVVFLWSRGPSDCYEEDGEFYRGMVSETVEGEECLNWNSYFILQKGSDPLRQFAGFDGIGPHNYCRWGVVTGN